jgi:ATP-dependent Lhr-like helicase
MGPLLEAMQLGTANEQVPLQVLWITPLRALANDVLVSLREAARGATVNWRIEARTGDTGSVLRQRQRARPPQALVTTPESLSVWLSYADSHDALNGLRAVIVDEWHELMGTKRGVQLELCLARLRALNPALRVWGLSATLGNLDEAMQTLMGANHRGRLLQGPTAAPVIIESVLPESIERFPWAGHLGVRLLAPVLDVIERGGSTLLFTNTRSQAELWYRAIVEARIDWIDQVAIHHASIATRTRKRAEQALREGRLRCVVCTSSLDLGVDFPSVDQVIQIGSPKGIARLLQRAGRSGHRPGGHSRIVCVPTHAFELVEFAAARQAQSQRDIEARRPLRRSLDVLVQHAMTVATGPGFRAAELHREVLRTHAFETLQDREWQWVLDFLTRGGDALQGYPQFRRVELVDGRYVVRDARVARLHRMSIGTITSDAEMVLKYLNGTSLGSVEETLIARLKPGESFIFAGKTLQLVRTKEMTAYVRAATQRSGKVARWQGGRMPLSNELAHHVQQLLATAHSGIHAHPEMRHVRPMLELQQRWSALPVPGELLAERLVSREGTHLFVYPFAGRIVNEGIAALLAFRWAQHRSATFAVTANDYGLELSTSARLDADAALLHQLLSPDELARDLLASLNVSEVARRQFRDIARVAGLVLQGFPGRRKSDRQLQASSGLMYDVLRRYDPGNLLLEQAEREVFELQLAETALARILRKIQSEALILRDVAHLTPLAFPLWADRLRSQIISTESWRERIDRMIARLERAAAHG